MFRNEATSGRGTGLVPDGGALAQAPAQSQSSANTDVPEFGVPIRVSVTNIIAPVLVTDRAGNIIDGLQPHEFHLFDNNKEQNIQVDVAFEPISLVVAIEASARVDGPILTQIKHLGTLLPLVVGDHGEAAVMAFDSRLRVMQDFTTDPDKIKVGIDKITAGNSSSRMIDAVDRAVYMLRNRPKDNRKIVLLVSETRDQASEGRVRESLIDAQLSNVVVYTVDITQLAVRLTEKPAPPRPNPIDITAQPTVGGNPPTPTTDSQNYGPYSSPIRAIAAGNIQGHETHLYRQPVGSLCKGHRRRGVFVPQAEGAGGRHTAHQPGDPQPVSDFVQSQQQG